MRCIKLENIKHLLSAVAIFCCANVFAQTATFDIITYNVPQNWARSEKQGLVSYSTSSEANHNFCVINLYASAVTKGSVEEEFALYWKEYAVGPFKTKTTPQTEKAEENGRNIISGISDFTRGSLTSLALLTVIVADGRTTCVLSLTNDTSYEQNIQDFLLSITLKKTTPQIVAPVVTPTVSGNGNTFHGSNKLEGVWNGININQNINQFGMNHLASNTPIWITFFDNGRVYNMLPDDFNTFNKNASDIGYYQITNGAAGLQWFKGTATTKIEFLSNDRIKVRAATGDQIYSHCKPVDGMRLEGAWTTFSNTKDPELDASGVKPQIHFFKDGHFTDDGIFMTLFYDIKTPPGSGTYSLNNFMLTLKYDNGTARQASFTGFISNDVSVDGRILFIDRHKFQKR